MFCYKCGNQINEEAEFCCKCGAKLLNNDTNSQIEKEKTTINNPQNIEVKNNTPKVKINEFIDDKIKSSTKYKSSEDLLKNCKPLKFVAICFVVGCVLGLIIIEASPAGILIGVLAGYIVSWIMGICKRIKLYSTKYPFSTDINSVNLNNLAAFLNSELRNILPQYDNWECCDEKSIMCTFNKKVIVKISFKDDYYLINAQKAHVFLIRFNIGASTTNAGFSEYNYCSKVSPILSAALEYYINNIQ